MNIVMRWPSTQRWCRRLFGKKPSLLVRKLLLNELRDVAENHYAAIPSSLRRSSASSPITGMDPAGGGLVLLAGTRGVLSSLLCYWTPFPLAGGETEGAVA